MEKNELLRRMEDLCERAERSGTVCSSGYLSPAERYQTEEWAKRRGCTVVFSGGGADCERTAAFFLPEYMSAEDFDPSEHFAAIKLTAHFGEPGHRDYMGAVLGMGVGREWVGDICVMGDTAYIFCLPSVHRAPAEYRQGRTLRGHGGEYRAGGRSAGEARGEGKELFRHVDAA